ncbi:cell division protein FtsI/penicillin-binding protein 2 [Paenibacillus sp. DS2015]|uniref:peptidoglycan D,D-transpeptidase FtsI family protein n=1 Tax=Paenibacillus sp. DS2015 TaxID=3373917 RepID=UPI003D1D21C1
MTLGQKKRIWISLTVITIFIVVLIIRLGYIQLFMRTTRLHGSTYTLQEISVLQRERGIILDSGRGRFYDRNGISLTGETIPSAVLFPVKTAKDQSLKKTELEGISEVLGTDRFSFQQVWDSIREPFIWKGEKNDEILALNTSQSRIISNLKISGIEVLPFQMRYKNVFSGKQWLGYLSQIDVSFNTKNVGYHVQKGAAGLEKTLEPLLHGVGPTIAYYSVDGQNRPIPDTGIRVKAPNNPYYPLKFITTIDTHLQENIERLTRESGMKEGAVVVLDVNSSNIVAMVSSPSYNPRDIHPEQGEWNNRALQATAPGSIFKTVIAAAALDAGITSPEEEFHCTGHYGKYGLSCWKKGGHGNLNLKQAYAQSCNVVFATLAERLSAEQIERTAHSLGLGTKVGWQAENYLGMSSFSPLDHEDVGVIFNNSSEQRDGGVRVQTGIGQRDVQVTPLQAANLVVTLLHEGQVQSPRILQQINYNNGQVMNKLKPHRLMPFKEVGIKPETARLLLSWMKLVVTEGTGKSLAATSRWSLAGKSGTAQVVWKGHPRNNQWFIGYGPTNKPKYAVAVLFRNVPTDTKNQATALFGQVMGSLSSLVGTLPDEDG